MCVMCNDGLPLYKYILPFQGKGSDEVIKRKVTSLCRLTYSQLHTWAGVAFPNEVLMLASEGDDYA